MVRQSTIPVEGSSDDPTVSMGAAYYNYKGELLCYDVDSSKDPEPETIVRILALPSVWDGNQANEFCGTGVV